MEPNKKNEPLKPHEVEHLADLIGAYQSATMEELQEKIKQGDASALYVFGWRLRQSSNPQEQYFGFQRVLEAAELGHVFAQKAVVADLLFQAKEIGHPVAAAHTGYVYNFAFQLLPPRETPEATHLYELAKNYLKNAANAGLKDAREEYEILLVCESVERLNGNKNPKKKNFSTAGYPSESFH